MEDTISSFFLSTKRHFAYKMDFLVKPIFTFLFLFSSLLAVGQQESLLRLETCIMTDSKIMILIL